jgi:hypothetical protein
MSYRSLRKFKQQQREYEFKQDRLADESFGEDESPSYDERELSHSDEHYLRLEAEVAYFSRAR